MTEEEEVIAFLKKEGFQEITPEMVAQDPSLQRMVKEFEQELVQHGYNSKVLSTSNRKRSRQHRSTKM
jgi:hypothetical protein